MATHDEFIAWIQHELQVRGWDQAELSRRGGLSRSQISKMLSGERLAGPNTCRALARAFHIPVEEVLRRSGNLPKSQRGPEGADELLFHYQNMGEEARQYLLKIARAFDTKAFPEKEQPSSE